ncbi:MAG: hypothetical protein FWE25_02515, partial [Lachnospiraceae bacterium]|nr:hypothetical protein [Lachnospiraceae bacterium]
MVKTIKKTERGENYETKHRFKRRFQTGGGNSSRRKKLAAIVSSVLAGAMLLTGTFAWSSISQRATNPIQGTPPPIEEGGRIH